MIDLDALQAPFAAHEHSWRAQSVARSGQSAQALCYITSRAVQSRLDAVCGPAGWQSRFVETASGRVICTIEIDFDGRWVGKSDGAGASAMEGEKGGLSGAFKRAGVMWGIGRYLYELPTIWADCEVLTRDGEMQLRNGKPVWKRWSSSGIRQLEDALSQLLARVHGLPARRAQERLPAPEVPAARLTGAPPFKQPAIVTRLLGGLDDAVRSGNGDTFWSDHFPQVPREWRAFVCAEKDRIRAEAGV